MSFEKCVFKAESRTIIVNDISKNIDTFFKKGDNKNPFSV